MLVYVSVSVIQVDKTSTYTDVAGLKGAPCVLEIRYNTNNTCLLISQITNKLGGLLTVING